MNIWKNVYTDLLTKSIELSNTIELINYSFSLDHNEFICPFIELFDIKKANKMVEWYKKFDESDCSIEEFFPSYIKVKNKTKPFYNSNYGLYIYKENQFDKCFEILKNNSESRQAQIIINRQEILHNNVTIDKLCTQSLTFLIRNKILFLIANMRSSDAVNLMPYDIYAFTTILKDMFEKLVKEIPDLKLGSYTHNAISLHIYKNDIEKIRNLI